MIRSFSSRAIEWILEQNVLELQLVEKEINGGNPAFPGHNEVSTGVSRRLAKAALHPLDPPAIARFLGLGYWLIAKVRGGSPEPPPHSIDLSPAPLTAPLLTPAHAIST